VTRLQGALHGGLANALREGGQYGEARKEYETALKIFEELRDLRSRGVDLGNLGAVAMVEGNLAEALNRHRAALALFQQLREPAMEAVAWDELGRVFQRSEQWDEAERHHRESARIKEEAGDLAGAARSWNSLAIVSKNAGKLEAAEGWYRKAIEGGRAQGDLLPVSRAMSNLADLLQSQPKRLAEARQLAEEALALKRTIDPGAAEIWTTYNILANIANTEASLTADSHRGAQRGFPGTRQGLKKFLPLIVATLKATQNPDHQEDLYPVLERYSDPGFCKLVTAVQRIVGGERSSDVLGLDAYLDPAPSLIVGIILAALADPSTLSDLVPGGLET